MSYFRGEKHTTQMNPAELEAIDKMIIELGAPSCKAPMRTKKFVAGLKRWYKGHGKLVAEQVYWLKYWHSVYC